ncbi:hypothetical protein [Crenobacter cavernae]|nr:hypothetical protein [Crenobacter cavernae]
MTPRLLVALGASLALLAGCASMMSSTTAKNAGGYGAKWFEQAGYPLDGLLQCQVLEPNAGTVNCSGTTRSGEPAVMSGDVNSPAGTGNPLVGSVGGREVFRVQPGQ